MLNRTVSLVVCLSILAGAAFAQTSNQGTSYIFEFANTTSASGQFQAFVSSAQSLGTPVFNTTGPAGANQVVAKPDGTKFYVIGSGGVQDFNPGFTAGAAVNGISGTPTQAVMSPDGRFLLVASTSSPGAGNVYVLNTTTDVIVLTQPVTGTTVGVVVSRDSATAWILTTSSYSSITIVNLTTQQQVGSPVILRDPLSGESLGLNAQAFALSPLGLLYVNAGNQIVEINPTILTASLPTFYYISVNATAGAPQFSPDSTLMYFVNTTPGTGGKSLVRVALPLSSQQNVIYWPPAPTQQTEIFDSIVVSAATSAGSPTHLFAHSPGDTTLWDVAPDFSTVAVSALNTVIPATSVLSMALSNEIPSAVYLYVLVGGGGTQASLYSVALATSQVNSQASAALGPGTLQFSIVPPESNPTNFLTFNAIQTVAAGATTAPLIARVLDPTGRPMFNVPVNFTGDPSLIFSKVTAATNQDGYAQAVVTMGPSSEPPGPYPVTLTAGIAGVTATTTFSLTVPGGVVINPSGGNSQISIVGGNGQMFEANFTFNNLPLTVLITDTNGNPLANQNVSFTVNPAVVNGTTLSIGQIGSTITGTNGQASATFMPGMLPQDVSSVGSTITASVILNGVTLGVTFNETIFQTNGDGSGPPSFQLLQPSGTSIIIGGEGDVIKNAVQAQIFSNSFGTSLGIPGVGMRILDGTNTSYPGPGTCQGNPLSVAGATQFSPAIVTCNFIPVCSTAIQPSTLTATSSGQTWGFGLHAITIDIGETQFFNGYYVNIVPGATQALAKPNQSGDGQSGRAGSALTLPLVATVTDQCGSPLSNITVTWKVTQGSATLAATSTVSNTAGTVATHVTLGQAPGTVTIVASINSTTTLTYTETIQAVVGSLKLFSGGGQSALLNQPFPAPVVFQLTDNSNNPIPGLTVVFSLGGGSASLSTTSATSNASGQVSLTVTAGNTAGTVVIGAAYSTFSASASLTVIAPGPSVTVSSFVNAASGQPGLTPCGLALVTGAGLAAGVNGIIPGNPLGIGPLPFSVNNVSISVDGTPAPIQSVSNQNGLQQVNFQTPCTTVTGSPATVVVQVGSVTTTVQNVPVYPAQPGIFTFAGTGGIAYGWVISAADGSYLTPSNLAHAGQTYYLVATGLGQTTPAAITDSDGTGSQTISVQNVILDISNIGIPVTSAIYLQGAIGEYVITFTIPAVANNQPFPTGTNMPLALGVTVNGQTFYDNSAVALPGIH